MSLAHALNDDRERDVELTLSGIGFLRFTFEQCTERLTYLRRASLAALDGRWTATRAVN